MVMIKPLLGILLVVLLCQSAHGWSPADSEQLIARMETAYRNIQDYQTRLMITGFGKDDAFQSRQELVYRFKKPNKIRIDFVSPHSGMTILYPTSDGKVLLQPSGWASVLTLRLDSRSSLLEISPGQQIDETDFGVLIANIRHSLTDMFLGELDVNVSPAQTVLTVLSDNPFQRGVRTRFIFVVDNRLSLPVRVTEMDPGGGLRRTVDYRDLKINSGLSEALFVLLNPTLD
jgi:outer membrane lipoprotein-sorting protein